MYYKICPVQPDKNLSGCLIQVWQGEKMALPKTVKPGEAIMYFASERLCRVFDIPRVHATPLCRISHLD